MQRFSHATGAGLDPLVSVAEAARQLGIARSTLLRQVHKKQVRSHAGFVRVSEARADREANLNSRKRRSKGAVASAPRNTRATRAGEEFGLGALWAARGLTYQVPAVAAISAAMCGVELPRVYALFRLMHMATMVTATDLLTENAVGPADIADAPIWVPESFHQVDWQHLADQAGTVVDLEAWEAFRRTLPHYEKETP